MKFVSYENNGKHRLALLNGNELCDVGSLYPGAPVIMREFLDNWDVHYPVLLQEEEKAGVPGRLRYAVRLLLADCRFSAPVPEPASCRDAYAFRQHVAAARRNRGLPMIPEFDEYPVFYFTNHHSIKGPGEVVCMPDHFEKLDFELEIAVVICRYGENIPAEEADKYIGGLMIMNDFSARTLQAKEMLLNLGPAKGKDFATTTGPWLVTTDELKAFEIPAKPGHTGKSWNLKMTCKVNEVPVSEGNLGDMDWTFAEIIERASYGTALYPGDIIGSGTAGTGCFLELNGTGKLNNPDYKEQWLQPGDRIDMEADGLGILSNTIAASGSDRSILKRKINKP